MANLLGGASAQLFAWNPAMAPRQSPPPPAASTQHRSPYDRALAMFDEVIALAPDQRAEMLSMLGRDDPATRDALHRLLSTTKVIDTLGDS